MKVNHCLKQDLRLMSDVEGVIVARENESESLREARFAADVERLIVACGNESESLREARLAADVERVSVARVSWSIFKGDIST